MNALRGAQQLVLDDDEGRVVLAHGRVVLDDTAPVLDLDATADAPDLELPPARAEADELMLVHRWLQRARGVRCHDATGVAASRLPVPGD
jgi:hypothetical protein